LIRLFTSAFASQDSRRRKEYAEALLRNLACGAIDQVCIFDQQAGDLPRDNPKIVLRRVHRRPDYADYFAWMNEVAADDDISILANADIWFDEQLALFKNWLPSPNTAFALARWERDEAGHTRLRDRNDSQDAWIFRGPVRPVTSDFPPGVPGCDNRMANELAAAGYLVQNPSFSITSFHLHAGERGEYEGIGLEGRVAPPYAYVWPHNLWNLPRTVAHNILHPDVRVRWRFDRRLWSRRFKVHLFRKGLTLIGLSRDEGR